VQGNKQAELVCLICLLIDPESAGSSETLVNFYQTTRRNFPGYLTLQSSLWESLKLDEKSCEVVDLIQMAQDMARWQDFFNMAIRLRVPYKCRKLLTRWANISFIRTSMFHAAMLTTTPRSSVKNVYEMKASYCGIMVYIWHSVVWYVGSNRCYKSHDQNRPTNFPFFTRKSFRICGIVVKVPGYRSRGPGFDSRRYQIFWEVVDLERGPLSFVRITEKLLEWKSSGSGLENRDLTAVGIRCADHETHSIRKSWH
jgi:hypothetical protein